MNFFQQIAARWKSDSPKFFVKIQNLGISLTATGTAAIGVPAIPGVHFPAIVATIGGHMVATGIIMGLVAKLACTDPTKLDQTATKP